MALDDGAVLVPATGHFYINPTVNSAVPADPTAPAAPWVDLGHTSLEDPFGITQEGGDITVLGSWQNKSLRTSEAPRTIIFTFIALQWDEATYKLYFGANGSVVSDYFQVPNSPTNSEVTLFVRVDDGTESVGIHVPKVSITRADDITYDSEALAGLPLRATALGVSGNDFIYQITPKGDLTPTP